MKDISTISDVLNKQMLRNALTRDTIVIVLGV